MDHLQVILSISVPMLAVLISILSNHSRLSDLRAHMDARLTRIEKDLDEMRP